MLDQNAPGGFAPQAPFGGGMQGMLSRRFGARQPIRPRLQPPGGVQPRPGIQQFQTGVQPPREQFMGGPGQVQPVRQQPPQPPQQPPQPQPQPPQQPPQNVQPQPEQPQQPPQNIQTYQQPQKPQLQPQPQPEQIQRPVPGPAQIARRPRPQFGGGGIDQMLLNNYANLE